MFLFQNILNRKHVTLVLAYTDPAVRVIQIFLLALPENIIQDLPSNLIVSFLEVDRELKHCFIAFPYFLKYLTNAEYMISS